MATVIPRQSAPDVVVACFTDPPLIEMDARLRLDATPYLVATIKVPRFPAVIDDDFLTAAGDFLTAGGERVSW
jgi:hypothetical protein